MKTKLKNKILSIAISLTYFFLPTKIFAQWNVEDPDVKNLNLPDAPVIGIVSSIVYWMLGILELISLIAFVIAGVMYLMASGDETQAGKAKKAMTYSILGIIVGLSGFVIFQAAVYLLNGAQMF